MIIFRDKENSKSAKWVSFEGIVNLVGFFFISLHSYEHSFDFVSFLVECTRVSTSVSNTNKIKTQFGSRVERPWNPTLY